MQHPSRRHLPLLGLLVALGPLSIDLYLPTFPELQRHFGASPGAVQATLSSYFFGIAAGQLLYGPLSDLIGRRRPLLFGLALYTFASLLCTLTPSIEGLIGLRLLQALGGCAGMVIARAVLRDLCEPQEMAAALSTLMLIMGAAPVLSPIAGAWLMEFLGWPSVFWVQGLIGLAAAVLVMRQLPETLAAPGDAKTLRHILAGYGRLLRHRRFMGYALVGGSVQGGMFAYIAVSSFVFMQDFGVSSTVYAGIFGGNAAGFILASQINRRLLRHWHAERVLRGAITVFASGTMLLFLALYTGFGGLPLALLLLFLSVSTLGFSFPNSTAAAMEPFGDRAGMASALLGTLQFTVAAVASGIGASVYNGEPWSMGATMACTGLLSLTLWKVLVPPVPEALRR